MSESERTTEPLAIDGEMTIFQAAELYRQLSEAGERAADLDLGGVTEIDTAGVQLLLALERWLAAQERDLCLHRASEVVCDGLATLGLGERFKLGPAADANGE